MNALDDLSKLIRPGDTVMWGQATAEPLTLTRALIEQRHKLGRLRLLLGIDCSRNLLPEHSDQFDFVSYCAAGGNRQLAKAGLLDIMPNPYSQFPGLIAGGALKVDVVLVQVSEPDVQGNYSLGLANDLLISALKHARVVIAEVNPQVPRTFGEKSLAKDEIDLLVPAAFAPLSLALPPPSALDLRIAAHVASYIEDGATLQLGLGGVAEAVLSLLGNRKHLGIHSGLLGDGIVELANSGALTNGMKGIDQGMSVAGVLMGTKTLYDFAHENLELVLRGAQHTHGAAILHRLNNFVAINSAIEVDLSGQVNAEVLGGDYVGAVGGAPDFLRAAQLSPGGVPIVALPSSANSRSRIVAKLSGPVTTARCDAGVFVTEYGTADLRGLGLAARAKKMLEIAAPEHREALARAHHQA